ncbi:MAG: hypothetical protein Q7R40_16890 [Phaeospirillum sp.]|nr:hypothetical protein [Phaeospirillum sp.]
MTSCAAKSMSDLAFAGASGGGVGLASPAANTVEATRRLVRFQRQLADEIANITDHGGHGSRQGLLTHLRHRFGSVEADDMLRAFDMLPAAISEVFK